MSQVKLGLIQMASEQSPKANLNKAVQKIKECASQGAQIICLQELFRTDYFCQTYDPKFFELAEKIPGPSTEVLCKLAREKSIVIVASLF
jgi:N-carbamoylputrescine amidase